MKNNIHLKVNLEEVYPSSTIQLEVNGEVKDYTLDKMTHDKKTNLQFLILNTQRLEKEQKQAFEEMNEEKYMEITKKMEEFSFNFLSRALAPIPKDFFESITDEIVLQEFTKYAYCYLMYSTLEKFEEFNESLKKKIMKK